MSTSDKKMEGNIYSTDEMLSEDYISNVMPHKLSNSNKIILMDFEQNGGHMDSSKLFFDPKLIENQ